jgi:arylsulfatase A-like enzyme
VVAVVADHGESLGEHREVTHAVLLYEATLHVPFLIAGPGVPAGRTVEERVATVDVVPTLLKLLG